MNSLPSQKTVKAYWERQPLGSLELAETPGSAEFFKCFDGIRERDEGVFARPIYEFEEHSGERVLDIGCGNGWLVGNFARGGANVTGIDLTETGVRLTRRRLDLNSDPGTVVVGDAESLPFADDTFDFVTASGVLHHTPDTEGAVTEMVRVLKAGGGGMVSLYYRHPLIGKGLWPVTRFLLRHLVPTVPGRDSFAQVNSADDLVRVYDGNENPVGKAYSRSEIRRMLPNCHVDRVEIHFFPTRFVFSRLPPMWLRRLFDRWFGLMIYVRFTKASLTPGRRVST